MVHLCKLTMHNPKGCYGNNCVTIASKRINYFGINVTGRQKAGMLPTTRSCRYPFVSVGGAGSVTHRAVLRETDANEIGEPPIPPAPIQVLLP